MQKRYQRGSLIVIASVEPLTNAGLRDENTARFVYREIVEPAIGSSLGFDEVHHSYTPAADEGPTVNTLLFDTAPGRAAVVAAVLAFAYMLLAGRSLGPPLPPRPSASVRRTMFEHVQMLAVRYSAGRPVRCHARQIGAPLHARACARDARRPTRDAPRRRCRGDQSRAFRIRAGRRRGPRGRGARRLVTPREFHAAALERAKRVLVEAEAPFRLPLAAFLLAGATS